MASPQRRCPPPADRAMIRGMAKPKLLIQFEGHVRALRPEDLA